MSAHKHAQRPSDTSKINMDNQDELVYWSKTLKVSKTELKDAIKSVGPGIDKIKEHLGVR